MEKREKKENVTILSLHKNYIYYLTKGHYSTEITLRLVCFDLPPYS